MKIAFVSVEISNHRLLKLYLKFGVSIDDFSVYESTSAEEAITKPVSHSLSSFMKKKLVAVEMSYSHSFTLCSEFGVSDGAVVIDEIN